METKKGAYILIEGGEGCGKGVHTQLLDKYLQSKGLNVIRVHEPGGTNESEQIRKILLRKENNLDPKTEVLLYMAARSDLFYKTIKPAIENGDVVLSDRGFPSTIAYQSFAGGVDLGWINQMNQQAMQGVTPSLIFILDVDPRKGLEKEIDPDRFAAKGLGYHQMVRKGYFKVAEMFPDISHFILYQEGNINGMQDQIKKIVNEQLGI